MKKFLRVMPAFALAVGLVSTLAVAQANDPHATDSHDPHAKHEVHDKAECHGDAACEKKFEEKEAKKEAEHKDEHKAEPGHH